MASINSARMKIAVAVLSYADEQHLTECYQSLLQQSSPPAIIAHISNASPDGGVDLVRAKFPTVQIFKLEQNFGYAGAYNRVIAKLFADDMNLEAALLLNSDTKADPMLLSQLIKSLHDLSSTKTKVGLLQPAVLLYQDPQTVNTTGNAMHYLGFGFCKTLGEPYRDSPDTEEIVSVSGCAMLVTRDYWTSVGELDEQFFMYNEDQNYAWRGLLKGYHHFVARKAVVLHKYSFKSSHLRWYNSEKNRLMMVLQNYEGKTLFFLAPALFAIEVLLLPYALLSGWLSAKLQSYAFLVSNWRKILQTRRSIQSHRDVFDQEILGRFDTKIQFGPVTNILSEKLLNPILEWYARLIFIFLGIHPR